MKSPYQEQFEKIYKKIEASETEKTNKRIQEIKLRCDKEIEDEKKSLKNNINKTITTKITLLVDNDIISKEEANAFLHDFLGIPKTSPTKASTPPPSDYPRRYGC